MKKQAFCLGILLFLTAFLCPAKDAAESVPTRFDNIIVSACKTYNLDPRLVKAVIRKESKFDPCAKGAVGEIGLMQIRRSVVKDWAKAHSLTQLPTDEDLYDPYLNIMIGTWKLSEGMQRWSRYSTRTPLALFEYNAGRSKLITWVAHYDGDTRAVIDRGPCSDYIHDILSFAKTMQIGSPRRTQVSKNP